MIQQPKCCGTCKRIQLDTNYCHRRKEVRVNIHREVKCEYHAKRWREGWRSDVGQVIRREIPVSGNVDLLSWAEV